MMLYVLHYGEVDNEGCLLINCNKPYTNLEDAKKSQDQIIRDWAVSYGQGEIKYEQVGNYKAAIYMDNIAEIQTNIEIYEL